MKALLFRTTGEGLNVCKRLENNLALFYVCEYILYAPAIQPLC